MSEFLTQKWLTRGLMDIVIDTSDKADKSGDMPVRLVAKGCGRGYDENIVNARLIAAAPEMYRLVREFAGLPAGECMIGPMIHEARRLIACIDGEEGITAHEGTE